MGFLYLDTSALQNAFKAGGTELLDIFAETAKASGMRLVVTDVVQAEVIDNKSWPQLIAWLDRHATMVPTDEGRLVADFRAGLNPKYNPKNRGERSILELLVKEGKNAASSAIFTDDTVFLNKQFLKQYSKQVGFDIERIVCTNGDMLTSAVAAGKLTRNPFRKYGRELRKLTPYNPALKGKGYSTQLAARLASHTKVQKILAGKRVTGLRLLGAFGRLMTVAGTAFFVVDGMTTAAKAAGQAQAGDRDAAAETLSDFGGRLGGALLFGEVGLLAGGIPGALIGGIFGSFLGETGARRLLHIVTGHADKDHISLDRPGIDAALTDEAVRDYDDQWTRALQSDMYQAGYSSPEVNAVCDKVSEQLHAAAHGSTRDAPGNPSEVFQHYAAEVPSHQAAFVSDPIVELDTYVEIVHSDPASDADSFSGSDQNSPAPSQHDAEPDHAPQLEPDHPTDPEHDQTPTVPNNEHSQSAPDDVVESQTPGEAERTDPDHEPAPTPDHEPEHISPAPDHDSQPRVAGETVELDTHAEIAHGDPEPETTPDEKPIEDSPKSDPASPPEPDSAPEPGHTPQPAAGDDSEPGAATEPVIELETRTEIAHGDPKSETTPDEPIEGTPEPEPDSAPEPDHIPQPAAGDRSESGAATEAIVELETHAEIAHGAPEPETPPDQEPVTDSASEPVAEHEARHASEPEEGPAPEHHGTPTSVPDDSMPLATTETVLDLGTHGDAIQDDPPPDQKAIEDSEEPVVDPVAAAEIEQDNAELPAARDDEAIEDFSRPDPAATPEPDAISEPAPENISTPDQPVPADFEQNTASPEPTPDDTEESEPSPTSGVALETHAEIFHADGSASAPSQPGISGSDGEQAAAEPEAAKVEPEDDDGESPLDDEQEARERQEAEDREREEDELRREEQEREQEERERQEEEEREREQIEAEKYGDLERPSDEELEQRRLQEIEDREREEQEREDRERQEEEERERQEIEDREREEQDDEDDQGGDEDQDNDLQDDWEREQQEREEQEREQERQEEERRIEEEEEARRREEDELQAIEAAEREQQEREQQEREDDEQEQDDDYE